MTGNPKVDRARRHLLKAAGMMSGMLLVSALPRNQAVAQSYFNGRGGDDGGGWNHGGGDDGGGGDNGGGWNLGGGGDGGGGSGGRSCFLQGTLIGTADGYRPVETLRVNDRVTTRFSGCAPAKRIAGFTLIRTGPNHSWAGDLRPVRVRREALGERSPVADLCLTAAHAVFKDGFLVPIGNLINGTTIVYEPAEGHGTLDFFHIELDRHDVLDAQGAACESLRTPSSPICAPVLSFGGGRGELLSLLRSACSLIVDRRRPLDVIRDDLEERALQLAMSARRAGLALEGRR